MASGALFSSMTYMPMWVLCLMPRDYGINCIHEYTHRYLVPGKCEGGRRALKQENKNKMTLFKLCIFFLCLRKHTITKGFTKNDV